MTDIRNRLHEVDRLAAPDLWPEAQRRASEPVGRVPSQERSRGGRLVAGAVALALFVGGTVLVARVFLGDDQEGRPRSTEPWSEIPAGWTQLPSPPFERSDSAAVWTGEELVLWGGGTDYNANFFADGAAYDPTSDEWRGIADGPLTARADPIAMWTGSEVLIWGGWNGPEAGTDGLEGLNDGGAYDPVTDSWRSLPRAPWFLPLPAASAWTGQELVLFGSTDRRKGEVSGMAYEPEGDSWRTIASAPMALNEASAVWTGGEVIVYGSDLNGRNIASTRWAQGMAYDPGADSWRVLPEQEISPQASWANWTGSEMLVWDYEADSALYDPATNSWREPNAMPIEPSECYPYGVRAAGSVFAWFCGQMASFDIARNRWVAIEPDPVEASSTNSFSLGRPVGAGDVVLLLVAQPDGNDYTGEFDQMWVYGPS